MTAATPVAADKGAAVVCDALDENARVMVDRARTLQLIAKVIAFEAKSTGDGGTIRLGVSRVDGVVTFTARAIGPGGVPVPPPAEGRGGLALLIARGLAEGSARSVPHRARREPRRVVHAAGCDGIGFARPPAMSRATVVPSVPGCTGFATCASKPAAMAFAASCRDAYAVSAMAGIVFAKARVRTILISSMPSWSGRPMSETRMSGRSASSASSAAAAVPTEVDARSVALEDRRDELVAVGVVLDDERVHARELRLRRHRHREAGRVGVLGERLLRGDGQLHRERGALARALARRDHAAAVLLDEVLDDGEPETEPARLRVLRLTEALEDVRQEVRRDALTRVLDDDPTALALVA